MLSGWRIKLDDPGDGGATRVERRRRYIAVQRNIFGKNECREKGQNNWKRTHRELLGVRMDAIRWGLTRMKYKGSHPETAKNHR